ncbi:MAG: pantetheine-phosphate adenylyltransferase [Eubacteriales bacterium]
MKALYAGSFDPLTNGHLDIITRASKLCDKLVVGVIANPQKKPMFSFEERKKMITIVTKDLKNVEVGAFNGLLADYVNEEGFDVVIRGLRANTDFEIEMQMAQMNARLYSEKVETVFLMTAPEYSFVSSSMIKEVFNLDGKINGLVPGQVLDFMEKKREENGHNKIVGGKL